jgi:prepilin-type N-terminal cleavage/methylation domain-containing protein
MSHLTFPRRRNGFTLIELSLVLVVVALLAAAALTKSVNQADADNTRQLNATLDAVEAALLNYAGTGNNRLPCPSDVTLAESSASFGVEVGTAGDGNCTGVNFTNSGTDPDATGGSDPGAPDALYDSATSSQIVAGSIPTKTLRLPDRFAYDPWGRKILYVVDKRMTVNGASALYSPFNSTIGGIAVKKTSTDSLANSLTYKGVYALISHGRDGHGGFARNPSATAVRFNAGSTNTDEQKNCHCNTSATATTFDRIFVQKPRVTTTTISNQFDDIVRYRTRSELGISSKTLQ